MYNTAQTTAQDPVIVRIDTGLSIAKIPSFTGRTVRLAKAKSNNSIREHIRGTPAAVGALTCAGSAKRGTMKRYYVAVCVPQAGGWRATFPDAPGCEVEASSLDCAVIQARSELASYASSLNGHAHEVLAPSRDLADIRSDEQWRAANAIDWPGAVVTMIPLSV